MECIEWIPFPFVIIEGPVQPFLATLWYDVIVKQAVRLLLQEAFDFGLMILKQLINSILHIIYFLLWRVRRFGEGFDVPFVTVQGESVGL